MYGDSLPSLELPCPMKFTDSDRDSHPLPRSGVSKAGACHLFRHTCATLMLEGGADIRFIQGLLGHADVGTTEIYTRVSIAKLREIHRATHPARWENGAPDGDDTGEPERLRAFHRRAGDYYDDDGKTNRG
ncbi:MAG: tyrosine-type recombinase/integrase [Acidobacteria bacterium]|nr:tyrosine-type recombinase/integrase [Acidobacteriota bacterium]